MQKISNMISILFKQNQLFLYMVHWFELVWTELNHIEPVQNGSIWFSSGSDLIDLFLVLVRAIDPLNWTELNFGNTSFGFVSFSSKFGRECKPSTAP
jgi:hypothetical protein